MEIESTLCCKFREYIIPEIESKAKRLTDDGYNYKYIPASNHGDGKKLKIRDWIRTPLFYEHLTQTLQNYIFLTFNVTLLKIVKIINPF
jgi:hypothetical protein